MDFERAPFSAFKRTERVQRSRVVELVVVLCTHSANIHVEYTGPDRSGMLRYNRHVLAHRSGVPSGDDQTNIDVALFERVADHDERAVGELYDRHSSLLYAVILRILRNTRDAEDVLQDVFVALWTRVHTYDPALGSPVAWLVRIARNRAIDRLRASGVRVRTAESAYVEPATPTTPEDHVAAAEESRAVVKALAALPGEQRVLIEDAYFLGLTHAELAERHRLPLGTVKTRIRTGMQTLRQALSADTVRR